jgi:hypothetical protein
MVFMEGMAFRAEYKNMESRQRVYSLAIKTLAKTIL